MNKNIKRAKFEYNSGKYTYLLISKPFLNMGDKIIIYKGFREILNKCLATATLDDAIFKDELNNIDGFELLGKHRNFRNKLLQRNIELIIEKSERESKQRQEYTNYSGGYSGSSLFVKTSNHDKNKCKQAYKLLSKKFHPDMKGGSTEMMQFVNQLKMEWAI